MEILAVVAFGLVVGALGVVVGILLAPRVVRWTNDDEEAHDD